MVADHGTYAACQIWISVAAPNSTGYNGPHFTFKGTIMRSSTFASLASIALAALSLQVSAQKLYWSDVNNIRRSNLDGSQSQLVRGGFEDLPYVAADPAAGTLYYTYGSPIPKMFRSDLNGNQVQPLFTFDIHHYTRGLAVDHAGGKIYWSSFEGYNGGAGTIRRANLDGSGLEDVVPDLNYPYGLALDVPAGKMYWLQHGTRKIQRANLDGSNLQDVVSLDPASYAFSLALDPVAQKIYWSDAGVHGIERANLDGTGIEQYQPLTGGSLDAGMAIDLASRSLFWSDNSSQTIYRGNLDGNANPTPIAADIAMSITLTPEPSTPGIVVLLIVICAFDRSRVRRRGC
jgi:DNA-binding beta-propeller fold protein YncE